MEVETLALIRCLRHCMTMGYVKIIMETDSLSLQEIITETDSLSLQEIITEIWEIPWQIRKYMEEIKQHMTETQAESHHIYREANYLADSLANHAFEKGRKLQFHTFQYLPR